MKAAVYDHTGGPEVLHEAEVDDPVPGSGEVLVAVEAISIEGGDTLNRRGGALRTVPHVVGYQCAGRVLARGPGAEDGPAEGSRVVTVGMDGSHAALRVVPAAACWTVPEGLGTDIAACVPIAFGTAHDALFEFGRLEPDDVALVHAGAGGVGIAAIQLAHRAGARVLATASSPERLARLEPFGLDDGIDYTATDFAAEVRRLTDGRGADVILDSVGGTTLEGSLRCLAYRGRCISFGDAGREDPVRYDLSGLRAMNQTLVGYFLGAELFAGPRAHAMVADLLDEVATGALQVVVDRTYPLADAADAHAYVESRQAFGRVVLVP